MSRPMCTICKQREKRSTLGMFCAQCARSYDKVAKVSGDIAIVIEWAANRARWFEHRRGVAERLRLLATMEKKR
jgi:hypothetical protein